MTKETRLEIINLFKFVFEDKEYIKAINYLQTNKLNDLRLLVDEKCEFLDITASFTKDEVDVKQLLYCQELENLVLDVLIDAT